MMTAAAFAFQPIPKASAKALGVTRGKSFSQGAVFVNGKYIAPPYVVERWGTGIRINQTPVTGQVVDWAEFVKTQTGCRVEKAETPVEETAPAEAPAEQPAETTVTETASADAGSLDDLFDDEPQEKAKKPAAKRPTPVVRSAPPKPKATVTYSFDGDFVPNERTKALVGRINQARTDIDKTLRSGGFICFGDDYPRVTGGSRLLIDMLGDVSRLQMKATDEASFIAGARAAGLVYLNEIIFKQLYRNRTDYRKLRERREKLMELQKLGQAFQEGGSLF